MRLSVTPWNRKGRPVSRPGRPLGDAFEHRFAVCEAEAFATLGVESGTDEISVNFA